MNELFYPIKPIYISQKFGDNKVPFYAQSGMKGHSGIDYVATHGQCIYAVHDGTCYPQVDSHGGNGIKVMGDWCETLYWHLIDDDAVVQTGQIVKAGDLLGYADNTGQSTGTHLHFGFALNTNVDPYNGYNGYIDPTPYFNGKYAQDILNPEPPFKFSRLLKMGSWNMEVKALQERLNAQGEVLVLDGIFGIKTQNAVKKFQQNHNLVPDGLVGPKTREVLNNL